MRKKAKECEFTTRESEMVRVNDKKELWGETSP